MQNTIEMVENVHMNTILIIIFRGKRSIDLLFSSKTVQIGSLKQYIHAIFNALSPFNDIFYTCVNFFPCIKSLSVLYPQKTIPAEGKAPLTASIR